MWKKLSNLLGGKEREEFIDDFNKVHKEAFVNGLNKILLEARITIGTSEFKHSFSKTFQSGFRIKPLTDKPLSSEEILELGGIILHNVQLVRKLISLGWDTLEVENIQGRQGSKWALKKYANTKDQPK